SPRSEREGAARGATRLSAGRTVAGDAGSGASSASGIDGGAAADTGGGAAVAGTASAAAGATSTKAGASTGRAGAGASPPAGGNGGDTDVGVTATSIKVGGTYFNGNYLDKYSQVTEQAAGAYFRYINDHGGIYGRKIEYHTCD